MFFVFFVVRFFGRITALYIAEFHGMNRLLPCLVFLMAAAWSAFPSLSNRGEAADRDDERTLQNAGLSSNGPALIAFFHSRLRAGNRSQSARCSRGTVGFFLQFGAKFGDRRVARSGTACHSHAAASR